MALLPYSERIRSLRIARGWSQFELAGASETTARTIQRVEAGDSVSSETLKAIASALETDFSQLVKPKDASPDLLAARGELDAQLCKREEIRQVRNEVPTKLREYWEELARSITIAQTRELDRWFSDFSTDEILESMDTCARQYLVSSRDEVCTLESAEYAFSKIPAVCYVNRRTAGDPTLRRLFFIRGTARNRIPGYFNNVLALRLLKAAHAAGVSIEALQESAACSTNWTHFQKGIEDLTASPPAEKKADEKQPDERQLADIEIPYLTLTESVPLPPSLPAPSAREIAVTPPANPLVAAIAILQRAYSEGEQYITIDVEEHAYYFGRSRDGFGTTYPVEHPLAIEELTHAIRRNFECHS